MAFPFDLATPSSRSRGTSPSPFSPLASGRSRLTTVTPLSLPPEGSVDEGGIVMVSEIDELSFGRPAYEAIDSIFKNEMQSGALAAYLERNEFQLDAQIGEGQSATVFRLNPDKVLKIFPNDPEIPAATKMDGIRGTSLLLGMRASEIVSPETVLIYNGFEIEGLNETVEKEGKIVGCIYPCIEGIDLDKLIKAGPLSLEKIYRYGASIGQGIQTLHAMEIYHRDLKPSNIRIRAGDDQAMLMDFDLARKMPEAQEPVTPSGAVLYRAPEAVGGHYSPACEAWSLGVILYEMAFRSFPFEDQFDICLDDPVKLPEDTEASTVPAALRELISGLLKKNPEERMSLNDAIEALGVNKAVKVLEDHKTD